jgi:smad nuclear-interacting protein 1
VKPYLLDLNSSNKTFLNGKEIEGSRLIELRESDVIKFGYSTREYVLVHEKNVS